MSLKGEKKAYGRKYLMVFELYLFFRVFRPSNQKTCLKARQKKAPDTANNNIETCVDKQLSCLEHKI